MALTSNYRWQEIDGVVVIRPDAAWHDPANVLNRPTASFHVENAHVHNALHVLLQAVTPPLFWPHTDLKLSSNGRLDNPSSPALIDAPVSLAFSGGNMLDALNALVTAHESAIWQVGYVDGRVMIDLSTLDFSGGSTIIVGAPIVLRQGRAN